MHRSVSSRYCKQVIGLTEPERHVEIPALSRLQCPDIPLQANAGIVVFGFIIVVKIPVIGVPFYHIRIVVDAVV